MALAGELAKYVGKELVESSGKELAKAGARSALSSLMPSVANKVGTELATKSMLSSLVPTASRKLANGIELGTDIIPMFRGQEHRLDQLDYNNGLSPNSNGFFMTPNKGATDSWAGKGVVSVGADPNDIMTLDELNALKKSAERYYRDPKYQMELYNTNPTQAEIYDALNASDNYQELSRLTKKPFIERDGGQGTELGEVVFFPDTNPELTGRYNADLASGKNQWLTPVEDAMVYENSVPAGTKISFNKDLSIRSIDKPSRGRGWFADNNDNPHIAQAIKQSGADKYLGKPKINYSLAEEPDITLYHGTPNKFEDFDESLPSVWFSDSDKNLKDTGLSIKGGQSMNVMERQLPRDLKIADEDLADRLTKQQLQDRGYAGIAYTERGPNGDETYYEIFSPNKTLRKMPKVQQSEVGLSHQQQEFFKDSVVRDENGELMPMYHGTRGNFTVFGEKNPSSSSNSKSGVGFWFTPTEEGAKNFASSIWYGDGEPKAMKTYLNLKNPKVYESVDNSKAVESLRKKLDEIELKSKAMSKPKLYYKNMYDYSVAYNMVNQGDKDTAIKWLAGKSGYDDKTATELIEEIDNMKMLEDEKKRIQNEISELKYGDAYERFRTDIYKVDGQTAEDANVGGIGMALNDDSSVQKYVDNLKAEGYDGIIIKGTNYDSDTMGGVNDQYVVFDPEQIKNVDNLNPTNNPDIRLSKNGESLTDIANRIKAMNKSGEMSSNIKRVGSSGVAEIDKDTLPAGYDIVKKYLGKSPADITKEIEDIIGVSLDDPSAGDKLAKFVEDEGYDVSKNIIDNLNTARQILDERTLDELNMEGAQKYAQFIQTRGALAKDNPNRGVGPRTFTISADDDVLSQTDAAKLDKEYSDRLGIGRSHTPMNDKTLSSDAKGYYMGGGIGINPLHARGETGVSTIAHERMHAWQDINSGSWDSRVGEAIEELRNELKKFYHTKDQIKAYRKSGYDLDYYADDKEQEARMLQSYLDNEGFTDTYHKNDSRGVEWGDEIKPAFDKFYNKLRKLSKAGVALPAIALLFGLNTNNNKENVDNLE